MKLQNRQSRIITSMSEVGDISDDDVVAEEDMILLVAKLENMFIFVCCKKLKTA